MPSSEASSGRARGKIGFTLDRGSPGDTDAGTGGGWGTEARAERILQEPPGLAVRTLPASDTEDHHVNATTVRHCESTHCAFNKINFDEGQSCRSESLPLNDLRRAIQEDLLNDAKAESMPARDYDSCHLS